MYSVINPERPEDKLTDTKPLCGPSVSTQRYSETKLKKTKRRSGTRGELGVMYEKKILMLGLYKALKNGYDFTLDTNIEGAGASDDVVFTYKENDGIEQQIYLQAKHNEDKNKKITYKDFLKSGNDDYALYKYFIDYKESIENVDKKCRIKIKYLIIYTKIDFHCPGIHNKGLRMHKKSRDEYFIFKKLDLFSNRPLDIFSTIDSNNSKKYPAFYQFSDKNEKDEDEKTRVINVLKNEFKAIDKEKKDPKLTASENELDFMLEGYINTLVFAVDQYDERKLGNQIKKEIKQDYQDSLTQDQVDFIFEYTLNKIGQWKNRSKAEPLTEKDDFFKQGKMKFTNFPALYPVLAYENELGALNIRFIKEKYRELNYFISSGKQLWSIFSNTSWLDSLVIYQALNEETLKEETGINYANHDHHLLLTGRDLLKGYEFVCSAFKAMGQSLLIIACEPTDFVKPKSFEVVNEIVEIVSASKSSLKQVIVIAPENHELSMQLKQKLTSSYYKEHKKIEFHHLTQESQEICLTAKKIRFQDKDELFTTLQLLGPEEEYPLTEETLAKFNLDSSELEKLLKSPVVEIGNEQPLLSHLESAYYKTHIHIELEQLEHILKENAGDIFTFVGNENEVKASFPPDQQQALVRFEDTLAPINGGFILLKNGQEEKQFKQLCHRLDKVRIDKEVDASIAQPTLHLLKKGNEGWIWTRTYSRHLYMERHFYPVIVNKDKMKRYLVIDSFSSDFTIFSGINEEALLKSLCINKVDEKYNFTRSTAVFREELDAEKEFERLTNNSTQQERSIHWLRVTEKDNQIQLQWHRSEGEINWIRSVLEQGNLNKIKLNSINEKILTESKARFIALADEPGMGKSTTLVHVTELMKQERPLLWVMKIDLNRYQAVLASNQVKTLEDLVGVLSDIDNKLVDPLTRRILMYQLTCPAHVALLWDGFDEVKLKLQDAVLALLKFLKKETAATIWVTTRRHDQEKLEERLSILAHPFEPLDKAKQIGFLSRFWATALKLTGIKRDLSVIECFAEQVVQRFEQSIQIYQGDQPFISIPLRAWMLAEVYQEAVEKVLVENTSCSEFFKEGKQIAIGNLYQQFIAKKYEIYLHEKALIGEGLDEESKKSLMRSYTKAYTLLAMQELFGKRKTAHFMGDKKKTFSLNILSRIGLIQGNEEPVNFIHRTFAEYFAGKWLAEHTENLEVMKFLGVQLFKKESGVVRCFFDHFITQNLLLHTAVLHGDEFAFQESLRENVDIEIMDILGRTALHLAAQEGRSGMIIQYLQRTGDNTLIRDRLGKTPLHYAAGLGHDEALNELLKIHVDINLDYHILRTPLHFDSEIGNSIFNNSEYAKAKLVELVNEQDEVDKSPLYYAADNGRWNTACSLLLHGADSSTLTAEQKGNLLCFASKQTHQSYAGQKHRLRPVVGFLSVKVPEAVQGLSDGYEYPRLLSYFFQHGHTKVIDALLRSIENEERRVRIANEPDNSYLALSRVSLITSNDEYEFVFSDTDYLKVVRYFYEQGRELGIKIAAKEANEFLESAAEHGFLKTYEYLYEHELNEGNVFLSTEARDKKNINSLFCNIPDLNYDNEWLQNLILYSRKAFGWTLLHLAAMNKNVKSIEEFLNPPIYNNINTKDTDGYTPLANASCITGRSNFIESLFVSLRKLDVNDRNQVYEIINAQNNINGMAPLHWVIYNEDFNSAKTLLKYIEDIGFSQEQLFNIINSRDFSNVNPICFMKKVCIVQLLFKYIRRFKFSPQQCIQILEGSGNLLSRLICGGFEEEALTLLIYIEDLPLNGDQRAAIVNMHYSENANNTPLHEAASEGYCYKVVLSLLKNGAVFNAYNGNEETPLDLVKVQEESYQKTHYLLSSVNRLYELTIDENLIQVTKKLDELKERLKELKKETWINPKSILNARNREGKTLLDLSKYQDVTNLFRSYEIQTSDEFVSIVVTSS